MTIAKFITDMKALDVRFPVTSNGAKFSDTIINTTNIWSNNACLGYLMMAAEDVNLDEKTLSDLITAMRRAFEDASVEEAEKKYEI